MSTNTMTITIEVNGITYKIEIPTDTAINTTTVANNTTAVTDTGKVYMIGAPYKTKTDRHYHFSDPKLIKSFIADRCELMPDNKGGNKGDKFTSLEYSESLQWLYRAYANWVAEKYPNGEMRTMGHVTFRKHMTDYVPIGTPIRRTGCVCHGIRLLTPPCRDNKKVLSAFIKDRVDLWKPSMTCAKETYNTKVSDMHREYKVWAYANWNDPVTSEQLCKLFNKAICVRCIKGNGNAHRFIGARIKVQTP